MTFERGSAPSYRPIVRRGSRALWLAFWFGLCALFASFSVLLPPSALAATEYTSVTGKDAYETSILLSRASFADGAEVVVVADGNDFRIATCSAVLAAVYEGPLLLTPADSLDPRVLEEISRLNPHTVYLVGLDDSAARAIDGWSYAPTSAAGGDVYAGAKRLGETIRAFLSSMGAFFVETSDALVGWLTGRERIVMLGGADAYETAVVVARQVLSETADSSVIVLASGKDGGQSAENAVSASTLASGKKWPLVFAGKSGVLSEGVSALIVEAAPSVVVEVGITVSLKMGAEVVKLRGKNASATSVAVAQYATSNGLSYSHLVLVGGSGKSSAHGWAVGAYLASDGGVALLCGGGDVPAEIRMSLMQIAERIGRMEFCGVQSGVADKYRLLVNARGLPSGFADRRLGRPSRGEEVTWVEQRLSDLGYRPGPIDGLYDDRTRHAIIAFEKWEGMSRDGVVGEEVWWRLLGAERPVPRVRSGGKWIEVNKKKQVLLYCLDGTVERIIPVSTGTPYILYGQETPTGLFQVTRKNDRMRKPRYHPMYIRSTNIAIHGYEYVPAYPASHGCIRIPIPDMDDLFDLVPVGTRVYIY